MLGGFCGFFCVGLVWLGLGFCLWVLGVGFFVLFFCVVVLVFLNFLEHSCKP